MKFISRSLLGLLAVLVLLVVGLCIALEPLLHYGIQKYGSQAYGAQVDVGDVEVDFWPLGVAIYDLEMTDPAQPTQNSVQVAEIASRLEQIQLSEQRVIVERVAVTGVAFTQPRREAGRVLRPVADTDAAASGFELPNLSLPDVDEVLARAQSDLVSVQLAEQLQQEVEQRKQYWQQQIETLPNKQALDGYRQRLRQLKQQVKDNPLSALSALDEIKQIKSELQGSIAQVKVFKQDFNQDLATLKKRLAEVKQAPLQDFNKLKQTYSVDLVGLENIAELVFGQQAKQLLAQLQPYLPMLESLLAPSETPEVVEEEPGEPWQFLVRDIELSGELLGSRLLGQLNNVSANPAAFGEVTLLDLQAEAGELLKKFSLTGQLSDISASGVVGQLTSQIQGLSLAGLLLAQSESFPLTLAQGGLDLNLSTDLLGETLNAGGKVAIVQPSLVSSSSDLSLVQQSLLTALNGLDTFALNVAASGALQAPDLSVQANTDAVIKQVTSEVLQQQVGKYEDKLKAKLFAQTDGQLAGLQGQLGSFADLSSVLGQSGQGLDTLLGDASADLLGEGKSKKASPLDLLKQLPF